MTNTAATPRFEVLAFVANYDCYDRITGWYGRRIAVTQTKAWALAIRDREECDYDIRFEAREIATGKTVYRRDPAPANWAGEEVVPF